MRTFISYQTSEKHVARKIQIILKDVGIESFLAHEDIHVSEEWRIKILEEIGKADIFVSIWSEEYYKSFWCIQESGIASFRDHMTIIPLSIDGSIPQGFSGNVQSTKIDADTISITDLLPGIVKANFDYGVKLILAIIENSGSYRNAESNFRLVLPYVNKMSHEQIKNLLEISLENDQILYASECLKEYLPPLYKSYGGLLTPEQQAKYAEALKI